MRTSGESTWVLRPELMGRCDICENHEREVVIKNAMTATKSLQEGQTCPPGSYSDWVTLILGSKYFLTNKALLWWLCSFIVLFCKFPDLPWILLLKYTLSGTKRIKLCNLFIQIICSKVSYSICIYCKVVSIKLLNKNELSEEDNPYFLLTPACSLNSPSNNCHIKVCLSLAF